MDCFRKRDISIVGEKVIDAGRREFACTAVACQNKPCLQAAAGF